MKPKIAILGSGWLGKPLAKELKNKGYPIHLSCRFLEKKQTLASEGFTSFQINLEQYSPNMHSFLDADILVVNIPSKNISDFKKFILEIPKSKIKKVLYISSTGVYSNCNSWVDEKSPLIENHPLVSIENYFKSKDSFTTSILRFSGLYGKDRQPAKWFQNKAVPDANSRVNMIHLDDCIAIINQIIQQDLFGYTLNACSDNHPTKEEFYTLSAQENNLKIPAFNYDSKDWKWIDNSLLKKLLNYQFIK